MNFYLSLFTAYLTGGLTFIPLALVVYFYCYRTLKQTAGRTTKSLQKTTTSDALEQQFHKEEQMAHSQFYKVGWVSVTRDMETVGKSASIGGIVKSYLNKSSHPSTTATTITASVSNSTNTTTANHNISSSSGNHSSNQNTIEETVTSNTDSSRYFAVLKFNTLYLYDSELQLDCKVIVNVSNHTVCLYPYGLKDHEAFSKSSRIQLKKKRHLPHDNHQKDYYINCGRCVDKEDWYIALKRASKLELTSCQHGEPPTKDLLASLKNSTQFDQDAMNHLISNIHSDPSHFEMQWFNALLGRLFLGVYKTKRTKTFFKNKILSKVAKLNARRPPFLEEISLRSVDGGHCPPQITNPRFIHLSPQGEYTGDMDISYDGHFRVEIETVLKWTYSDRLPPIRIDLVLAITLKSIQGKMMLKVKEPPTNRVWMGFYQKPKMEWIVEPVVWEKRIGYSVVSKAIQSKIEEIFTETMVLPNMDDMVFFQTETGAGGIFDDSDTSDDNKEQDLPPSPPHSYQSLPELYSTPSQLVVTADPLPLLSTSVSSTAIVPIKKRWFKRRNNTPTTATLNEQVTATDYSDPLLSNSSESDTLSQQTLKSVITSTTNQHVGKKVKRKKSIMRPNNSSVLAANVDHSIDSLSKFLSRQPSENLTVQTNCLPQHDNVAQQDAMHSVRLSKKMLLSRQPSRLRSKSLPSTGLTEISVVKER